MVAQFGGRGVRPDPLEPERTIQHAKGRILRVGGRDFSRPDAARR